MTARTLYDITSPREAARTLWLTFDDQALWVAHQRCQRGKASGDLVAALFWAQTYDAIARLMEALQVTA